MNKIALISEIMGKPNFHQASTPQLYNLVLPPPPQPPVLSVLALCRSQIARVSRQHGCNTRQGAR